MDSRKKKILAAIVALCVIGAGAYIVIAALGPNQTTTEAQPRAAAVLSHSDLMVRAVDPKEPTLNGRVYVLDEGHLRKQSGDLACERVYFAAGHGVCMGVAPSGVEYTASTFNSKLQREHTITLTGLPSRTRVSPDGRYGAMTVFVTGDSYLSSPTAFSTRTTVLEMASGEQVSQLEQFKVSKDGKPFDAVDFNFWGVTFDPSDSDHFYATLGTGGDHYLVEGSVSKESMTVLRPGVECPSLSPDGKQIAYKSRIGDEARWHLRVLDVATLDDHAVAEERSIDDQVEWLDDDTLVYSDGRNVYTVPADGSGASTVLVRDATSPVRLEESGQVLAHSQR
jgi:WD40-like Beta Propeller Repeat